MHAVFPHVYVFSNAVEKVVLDEDLLLLHFIMRIFKGILKENGRTRLKTSVT